MQAGITYTELLKRNAALADSAAKPFRIAILSNITIAALKDVLEYSLRSRGIAAVATVGDYDNVAQDSARFADHEAIVIFYELANIVDALPLEPHRLDAAAVAGIVEKAKAELTFVFETLASARLVVFNLLTARPFTLESLTETPLDVICNEINEFVRTNAPASFKLVDPDKVLVRCSVPAAIDLRFFLSSRALYQYAFLRAYAELVWPMIAVTAGHYKKVLVLDCDNTLWKGILGEEGLDGIKIFKEVQSHVVQLAKRGVLVCLCSKNNPEDVDAALRHADMVIRDEHLIVKAVNWNDKAENIAHILGTLNLGADSVVFVDDSDFELERVKERFPTLTTFKVPASQSDYLWMWQSIAAAFYREKSTADDLAKADQYRSEFARVAQRAEFSDMGDYLASLGLAIKVTRNSSAQVPRLAQLTQKTNQFNLTTRRMTEAQLGQVSESPDSVVLGIDVTDRFGNYGTTGLIVVNQSGAEAHIDNFLLSCRVIGRGVELRACDVVIGLLRDRGVERVYGSYHPTAKNAQVSDFYDKAGFELVGEEPDGVRRFALDLRSYRGSGINYIKVENA